MNEPVKDASLLKQSPSFIKFGNTYVNLNTICHVCVTGSGLEVHTVGGACFQLTGEASVNFLNEIDPPIPPPEEVVTDSTGTTQTATAL